MQKPVALAVRADKIPDELKGLPRWAAWRYEEDGRPRAVCVHTGGAVTADPETWASFGQALAYYQEHCLDGVGLTLCKGDPHCCVELTNCRDPHGAVVHSWARSIVADLNSYTEVLPCGSGVKTIVRADAPAGARLDGSNVRLLAGPTGVSLTGRHLAGTPESIEHRQSILHELVRAVKADGAVVSRARRARNGEKFRALFDHGDTAEYAFEESADLALAGMLAYWLGQEATPQRLEHLFARSALGRRRDWLVRNAYREGTIAKALEGRGLLVRNKEDKEDNQDCEDKEAVPSTDHPAGSPSMADMAGADNRDLFALARRPELRAEDVGACRSAVEDYCARTGKSFDDCWLAFLACRGKVLLPEGADALEWALAEGERHPVRLPPDLEEMLHTPLLIRMAGSIAGTAYHLSRLMGDKPFLLPVERLGALLGTSAMTISRVVQVLEEFPVVRCVEGHDHRAHRAKKYVWVMQGK